MTLNGPWFKRYRPIRVIVILFSFYGLTCWGLWRNQTRLMFFPSSVLESTPADLGIVYEDVWLQAGQIHGWWIPAVDSADAPVILYLHGNGSNLGDLSHRLQRFHRWGYGVLAIDYRGYGHSKGPFPSEQQVYADAGAAWRYLTEQRSISAAQIVIYGRSIGGAIAIQLATSHPQAAGLVLESTFTSMKAMVNHYLPLPLLPVEPLLHQRFESLEKVRSLSIPVLLMHGTADRVVPAAMSRTLYESWPVSTATLLWVEGAGHSNLPMVAGERYNHTVKTFVTRYAE